MLGGGELCVTVWPLDIVVALDETGVEAGVLAAEPLPPFFTALWVVADIVVARNHKHTRTTTWKWRFEFGGSKTALLDGDG